MRPLDEARQKQVVEQPLPRGSGIGGRLIGIIPLVNPALERDKQPVPARIARAAGADQVRERRNAARGLRRRGERAWRLRTDALAGLERLC